ncbi:MAG: YfgM family protein, partial [Saezia sp.]
MATQHLNLEEQEQLAQLKNFWADYGRAIVLAVMIFVGTIGGWYTWNWWQDKQGQEAAVLYDQLNLAMMASDQGKVKQVTLQMQSDYKSTYYASLASLVAASYLYQNNDLDTAASLLSWVKENGKDKSWNALAVLRLADVLTDQKKYDEALSLLSTQIPEPFKAHVADKRGNIYVAQGDADKA